MPANDQLNVLQSSGNADTESILPKLILPPFPNKLRSIVPEIVDWENKTNETIERWRQSAVMAIRSR